MNVIKWKSSSAILTSPKTVRSAAVRICLISDKQMSGAVWPASNTLVSKKKIFLKPFH